MNRVFLHHNNEVFMHYKKLKITHLFSTILLICSASIAVADHHHAHQHEKIFAMSASRPELIDAYLSKCAEAHHLAHKFEETRNSGYHWKDVKKAFGVGAVVGASAVAIIWVLKR